MYFGATRRIQKDVKTRNLSSLANTHVTKESNFKGNLWVNDAFVLDAKFFQSFKPSSFTETGSLTAEQMVDGLIDANSDSGAYNIALPSPESVAQLIGNDNVENKYFQMVCVNQGPNTINFFTSGWTGNGLQVQSNNAAYYRAWVYVDESDGTIKGRIQNVGRTANIVFPS